MRVMVTARHQSHHHRTGGLPHRLRRLVHHHQPGTARIRFHRRSGCEFQRDFNRAQPGDPAKAAAVILQVASLDEPPLRLLLGSDVVHTVERVELARTEADRKWRHLSVSTDFDAER